MGLVCKPPSTCLDAVGLLLCRWCTVVYWAEGGCAVEGKQARLLGPPLLKCGVGARRCGCVVGWRMQAGLYVHMAGTRLERLSCERVSGCRQRGPGREKIIKV